MIKLFNKRKQVADNEDFYEQVFDALKEVMPEKNQKIQLSGKTKIESLGIDSIKYINLFISLEEIIGKELEDIVDSIDLSSIKTVDDIHKLVVSLR